MPKNTRTFLDVLGWFEEVFPEHAWLHRDNYAEKYQNYIRILLVFILQIPKMSNNQRRAFNFESILGN
ncbi:hypothetical protein Hanom_Chr01g00031021 [Helianthus anomalus]